MRKMVVIAAGVAVLGTPVCVWGAVPFGNTPDWESTDERATIEIALADFDGDGWQNVTGERKTGDGERHVFYLEHFPALTITAVRVNGTPVPRADYCFDARAGWFSLKDAPGNGARVDVDYKWSNRLDLFAGNTTRSQTDNYDVIYFNRNGALEVSASWFSEAREETYNVKEGDYDADGDVDVAINGDDYIMIYNNTGFGLERTPSWSTALLGGGTWCFAWGDVDNDDYLELAVSDMRKFYVFKNNAGTLESSASWSVDFGYSYSVAWGDVDGDGDMDLAGCTYAPSGQEIGYAYLFRNNSGTLEKTPYWRNDPPAGRCNGLAWGDADGDGWLDLVKGICGRVEGHDPYADIYFSNRGVLPPTPGWESDLYTHCFASCLVDADSDGLLDLIQAEAGIAGYFRVGGRLTESPGWDYHPGPPYWIQDIRVGDVNADGYVDVAAACIAQTGYPTGGPNKLFLNKADIGINVENFSASSCTRGVALRWEVNEAVAGFNLYREIKAVEVASEPRKINEELITGRSPYRYVDTDVSKGVTYQYWLEVVPLAGPAERHGPAECTAGVKTSFALAQNAPNPARTTTTFAFSVPAACDAALTVYDIAGRKVATPYAGRAKAGANELAVDVSTLAPGVYTYRLEAGGATAAKRMVVVR